MFPLPALVPRDFVLVSTEYGPMIVNRNDYRQSPGGGIGVGHQLMSTGVFDPGEIQLLLWILDRRREAHGDGVVALDGGANVGAHSLPLSRHMRAWGSVLAFEAQEVLFYALAGNVVLNNCMNVRARHAALAGACGIIPVPRPNYSRPGSFGSVELRHGPATEDIGQPVSYDPDQMDRVACLTIDSLELQRLDLCKLDVEGMEAEVFAGATETLRRLRPVVLFEHIKSDRRALTAFLGGLGYLVYPAGMNCLAIPVGDPLHKRIRKTDRGIELS